MAQIVSPTDRQIAVLAHKVVDPWAWIEHANAAENVADPEAALVEKVVRWEAEYDAAVADEGENYKTRAERDATAP